jgi:DNA-binding NtrC family response regulator
MPTLESVPEKTLNLSVPVWRTRKLLSISPDAEDHAALRRILGDLDWEVWPVATCWDAIEQLVVERFSVVFCDNVLADGTWKDILRQLNSGAEAPPLVVTSRLADAYLWSEVLNLGGYDVVSKPFDAGEVSHVITTVSLQEKTEKTRLRAAAAF